MNKEEFIADLKENTYCRIGVSKVAGVGVIAIKRIPKGVCPFSSCKECDYLELTKEDLAQIDKNVAKLVHDMCAFNDGVYYVPDYGINQIDIASYLNHSTTPNMVAINEGDNFIALRDIEVGEELLVDYGTYNEELGI